MTRAEEAAGLHGEQQRVFHEQFWKQLGARSGSHDDIFVSNRTRYFRTAAALIGPDRAKLYVDALFPPIDPAVSRRVVEAVENGASPKDALRQAGFEIPDDL